MSIQKYVAYVEQTIATQTVPMTYEAWNKKQLNYPVIKVIAISSNANSFGLHGVMIMSTSGVMYEIGVTRQFLPKINSTFESRFYGRSLMEIYGLSYEIPTSINKNVPLKIIEKVWNKETATQVAEERGELMPDNTHAETRPSSALVFTHSIKELHKDLV